MGKKKAPGRGAEGLLGMYCMELVDQREDETIRKSIYPLYILYQILYDKTVDVGKTS